MTTCQTCGAPLPGAPAKWRTLRRYCGPRCRRQREFARRKWDRAQAWIRAADMNAAWPGLNPAQRENHRRLGEELRREAGARP
jgi:hypothetical protein